MRKIFPLRNARLVQNTLLVLSLLTLPAFAQNPTPSPTDKRDIGLQPNQQTTSQADQTKGKEAKPELVLQTGYNNFYGATRLAFSPDGRLLATATFHTNTIKLWEIRVRGSICCRTTWV